MLPADARRGWLLFLLAAAACYACCRNLPAGLF